MTDAAPAGLRAEVIEVSGEAPGPCVVKTVCLPDSRLASVGMGGFGDHYLGAGGGPRRGPVRKPAVSKPKASKPEARKPEAKDLKAALRGMGEAHCRQVLGVLRTKLYREIPAYWEGSKDVPGFDRETSQEPYFVAAREWKGKLDALLWLWRVPGCAFLTGEKLPPEYTPK